MTLQKFLTWDAASSQKLRLRQTKGAAHLTAAFLAHSGDSWFWLLGLFIVWLLRVPDWHRRTGLLAAGIIALAVMVLTIKRSVRRQRPAGEWGAIYRATDPHSFPSGHAARAALLAVMACGLGPAWFAAAVVCWTPLVSLARVVMGVHYLSDVLAGTVLGVVVGALALAVSPWLVGLLPWAF